MSAGSINRFDELCLSDSITLMRAGACRREGIILLFTFFRSTLVSDPKWCKAIARYTHTHTRSRDRNRNQKESNEREWEDRECWIGQYNKNITKTLSHLSHTCFGRERDAVSLGSCGTRRTGIQCESFRYAPHTSTLYSPIHSSSLSVSSCVVCFFCRVFSFLFLLLVFVHSSFVFILNECDAWRVAVGVIMHV